MKLHIGCGEKYLPGYKHVDARNFPHVDYVTDKLDKLEMFENDSVDEIYACHILEHFPRVAMKPGKGGWKSSFKRMAQSFKSRRHFENCSTEF